ncbi:hypothetical protein K445DRAFT_317252, partial [Daldinia sp. EC12]
MPWFVEIEEIAKVAPLYCAGVYRGLFYWALDQVAVCRGIAGPLMYVANRRRIWGACEEIAACYHDPEFYVQEKQS